jgi:hypothetical protein
MLEVLAKIRDCHGCGLYPKVARAWHCENASGYPPGFDSIGILVHGSNDSLLMNKAD